MTDTATTQKPDAPAKLDTLALLRLSQSDEDMKRLGVLAGVYSHYFAFGHRDDPLRTELDLMIGRLLMRISGLLPPVAHLGPAVLALGGLTALYGVGCALAQRDYKRLLAYSSVENIGIIFMGIGLGWTGRGNGLLACQA